ncbi:MAG: DUF3016 domain-containing protein, partial [Kangiellaceae bacterium]|nr:DUF3016 domain-containing protein [Kangiellaceae bacterium]
MSYRWLLVLVSLFVLGSQSIKADDPKVIVEMNVDGTYIDVMDPNSSQKRSVNRLLRNFNKVLNERLDDKLSSGQSLQVEIIDIDRAGLLWMQQGNLNQESRILPNAGIVKIKFNYRLQDGREITKQASDVEISDQF